MGAVAAVMAVAAPAASAAGVEDAQGCTTEYLKNLLQSEADPQYVEVTYTPPATVTVSADGAVNAASYYAALTLAYVNCVV